MNHSFSPILIAAGLVFSQAAAQNTQSDSVRELSRRVEIITEEIEKMKLGEVEEPHNGNQRGLGPAASRVYSLKKMGVSVAGYGEITYENLSRYRDDGPESMKKDQLDFLRAVVYFGYRFNDWVLFNSEVEFEHATTGKSGEVSVEFGYVELMFCSQANVRAGMILPPVGLVNERHEPSTFFGTLRPSVERSIIPSTWRTIGFGVYGEAVPSVHYALYFVEGLNALKFNDADGIRGGRQSGSKSVAEDFGLTGKIEVAPIPGVSVGGSFYTGNSGQGAKDSIGVITAGTQVLSVHGEAVWRGLEVRALAARTTVTQAGRLSTLIGKTIGSSMTGWYVVAGYDLLSLVMSGTEQYLAPFLQYESLDTHDEVDSGFMSGTAFDRSALILGVSYKPHPNVAFKWDFRNNKNKANTGIDQWNLAVNYLF